MRRFSFAVLLATAVACGGGSSAPTTPGVTPTPTPTPVPTPTPNPFAAACGQPLPSQADAYGFAVKVQLEPSRNKKILNASPQVRNSDYCRAASLPGQFCNTRIEDNPERVPCDHFMSGISFTGRPGPNWFEVVNGQLLKCGGEGVAEESSKCHLKPENQYLIDVTEGGLFRACAGEGTSHTCGGCVLADSTFGKIHDSPAGLCKLDPGD